MLLYVLTLRCIVPEDNPKRCLLNSVKPATPFVLSPLSIFVLSLPVSPCRYCFLSFFPLHNWILFSCSFTLCLSVPVRVQGGHQTMAAIQPLHAGCAGWHCRDGGTHAVACCSRVHLEGRDNRRLKRSVKRISRPRPCLFIWSL